MQGDDVYPDDTLICWMADLLPLTINAMELLSPALAFAALIALSDTASGQGNTEEQAVRKVVTDFVEAINRSDIKAFGALFTEDADFVVITGKYLKGREEIVTYHARLFVR